MDWVLGLLCGLLGLLLVVTLVGHGLWVLLAAMFRPGRKRPRLGQAEPPDELTGTSAVMDELLHQRLIDVSTHFRVKSALETMRRHFAPPPLPVLPLQTPAAEPLPAEPPSPQPLSSPMVQSGPAGAAVPLPRAIAPPIPPPAPRRIPRPRRSMADVFAAFMRESNIRWGELVGGLLIVGCSVALVISFWGQIAASLLLQFGTFTTVTTALLALGLYAEHRWKLPTTSRGILLIATLLVPLNFLAFAALSHGEHASALVAAMELCALGVFGFLVWRAAGVLLPYWPRLLTAGVLGLSGSLLLARHLGPARSEAALFTLAALPVILYGTAIGFMLRAARGWKQIRGHTADAMFLLLGVLTFGTILAGGLVVFQTGHAAFALHQLAPLLGLSAAAPLATGLLLWRRITDRRLNKARTAGTSIAVASAFIMLGAIGLAWPEPSGMLPLASIDFLLLTAIGVWFEIPAAHLLAGPCGVLAYLLGFHLVQGHIRWTSTADQTMKALAAPGGGAALIPLFVLTAAVSAALARIKRSDTAKFYAFVAVFVAGLSLLLVSSGGFAQPADPYGSTWVYLFYAIASFGIAWLYKRQEASWAGWVLLLAACLEFFASRQAGLLPWATALLAYATAAVLAVTARTRFDSKEGRAVARPARWMAVLASAATAVLLGLSVSLATAGAISGRVLWLSGLWLALALTEESAIAFAAGQIGLAAAVVAGVIAGIEHQPWFVNSNEPLLDPGVLQSVGLALGLLCIGWSFLRRLAPRRLIVAKWLSTAWSFDRLLTLGLAAGVIALGALAILPGIQAELATSRVRVAASPIELHAAGSGSWLMLAAVLVAIALWLWDDAGASAAVLLLPVLLAAACPLWAARWTGVSAGASALRWSLATYLAVSAVPLWMRGRLPLVRLLPRIASPSARELYLLLACIAAGPILWLSIDPTLRTLEGYHVAGPAAGCFFARIGASASYTLPLFLVAAVFAGNAIRERSSGWAFASSCVCNLTVTLGYALAVVTAGRSLALTDTVRLVQLNILALGGFACAWRAVRCLRERTPRPPDRAPALLWAQVAIAVLANAILLTPAALLLFVNPDGHDPWSTAAGNPIGWCALLLTIGAAFWTTGASWRRASAGSIAIALAGLAILVGCAAEPWNGGNWISYHAMLSAGLLATAVLPAAGRWIARLAMVNPELAPALGGPPPPAPEGPIPLQYQRADGGITPPVMAPGFLSWTTAFSAVVLLLSVRAVAGDPQRPWWSVTATILLSVLWTGMACWTAAPRLLYAAGLLFNLAATMWLFDRPFVASPNPAIDLAAANLIVLAASGLAALVLHMQVFRSDALQRFGLPPFHRFASIATTLGVAIIAGLALWGRCVGQRMHGMWQLSWAAAAAAIILNAAINWDRRARPALDRLYLLGLAAIALALDALALLPDRTLWALGLALAVYVLFTGALYAARGALGLKLERRGREAPSGDSAVFWLPWANIGLAATVTVIAIGSDFHFASATARLALASAAVGQIAGLVLGASGSDRLDLRQIALLVTAPAAVAWGWAWMSPADVNALDRSVAAMVMVLGDATVLASAAAVLRQKHARWALACRMAAGPACAVAILMLLGVIGLEIAQRVTTSKVSMHPAAVMAMAVTLIGQQHT